MSLGGTSTFGCRQLALRPIEYTTFQLFCLKNGDTDNICHVSDLAETSNIKVYMLLLSAYRPTRNSPVDAIGKLYREIPINDSTTPWL